MKASHLLEEIKRVMKKVLMGIIVLLMAAFIIKPNIHAQGEEKIVISAKENSILAETGDEIDLNDYVYVHSKTETLDFSEVNLSTTSSGIEFDGLKIEVKEKGVHTFLLKYESVNMFVYIIAKDKEDDHYVLYEEDFTGMPNGKLPHGYEIVSGTAGIQDERLYVSGTGGSSIVLLPSYLRSFMNYIIEVDFTIGVANNLGRWGSVMFRYNTENYYQMAIRKDATAGNGVEFAKRISGNWNVTNTTSFHEVLDPLKMYHLKIDVMDTTVKEYMDSEEPVIIHEQAIEFKRGNIGVQADGSDVFYDNFKIILPVDYMRDEVFEFEQIVDVYQTTTGIVNPATVVTSIESLAQLQGYRTGLRPATGILNVDGDLNVVSSNGAVIGKLYDVLIEMNGKIIPAVKAETVELAELVADKFRNWGIIDTFIISSNKEAILAARDIHPMFRGILDYTAYEEEFTNEKLFAIRKEINEAQAVAVILNEDLINKEDVQYLQQRLMTVWTTSNKNNSSSHYRAILSGVNGIVSPFVEDIYQIYESITDVSHVRMPFIIAHRGLHNGYTASDGPENSIEVGFTAINNGAHMLETDIHLTYDQDVVVMHDDSASRTTGYPFMMSGETLDILTMIPLIDISNTGKTFFIPSYREYLEAYREFEDVILFIEIKPTNRLLLEKFKDITLELGMEDRVATIMFGAQNAIDFKEVMPSMSTGYLTGALLASTDPMQSLLSVLTSVVPMKSTLNPSYGPVSTEIVQALTHRGITVWPWTIDDLSSMVYNFNAGVGGITTNMMDLFIDVNYYLEYENLHHQVELANENFRIDGQVRTLKGDATRFRTSLNIISNTANAVFDNAGKLVSKSGVGKVEFYTRAQSELPNGQVVFLLSDLMSVEFVEEIAPTPVPTPTPSPTPEPTPEPSPSPTTPEQPKTIFSSPWFYVGLGGLTIGIVGSLLYIIKFRKK